MKAIKMLLVLTTLVVIMSACNTDNPMNPGEENNTTLINPNEPMDPNTNWDCDWYRRDMENGGPHGYEFVLTRKSLFGQIILCRDPGYRVCPQKATIILPGGGTQESPSTDVTAAANYAYAEISNGNLVGLQSFVESGLTVRWSATSTDINTGKTSVKVWETAGTEPY